MTEEKKSSVSGWQKPRPSVCLSLLSVVKWCNTYDPHVLILNQLLRNIPQRQTCLKQITSKDVAVGNWAFCSYWDVMLTKVMPFALVLISLAIWHQVQGPQQQASTQSLQTVPSMPYRWRTDTLRAVVIGGMIPKASNRGKHIHSPASYDVLQVKQGRHQKARQHWGRSWQQSQMSEVHSLDAVLMKGLGWVTTILLDMISVSDEKKNTDYSNCWFKLSKLYL